MRSIDVRTILDAIAVATTGDVSSEPFDMIGFDGGAIGLEIDLSGAAADIKIEFLVATSRRGTYHSVDDQDTNDLSTIVSSLTSDRYMQFDPPIGRWFKIKVTGVNSNGADTTVTIKLVRKED